MLSIQDDDDDDPRGIPASDTEMESAVFGSCKNTHKPTPNISQFTSSTAANNSDVYGAVTFDSQGEYGAGPAAIGDDYMKAPAPATECNSILKCRNAYVLIVCLFVFLHDMKDGNAAVVDEYMKPGPPAVCFSLLFSKKSDFYFLKKQLNKKTSYIRWNIKLLKELELMKMLPLVNKTKIIPLTFD